jgi:hypothetical protein
MSEPTRDELLAQVAALQLKLSQQPSTKSQIAPTAQQLATVRGLVGAWPRHGRTSEVPPDQILAEILALRTVIASGVNSAGYGDKRTEFRSLIELRQILKDLEENLAEALGTGSRVRQIRMTTAADKGL